MRHELKIDKKEASLGHKFTAKCSCGVYMPMPSIMIAWDWPEAEQRIVKAHEDHIIQVMEKVYSTT